MTGAQLKAAMEKTRAKLQPGQPAAPASISGQTGFPSADRIQIATFKGEIEERHWPKKHPPGTLKRGDSVWYRGERFWVEYAPSTWVKGCYARISSKPVHPDIDRPLPTDMPVHDLVSFCVHVDSLDLAPPVKNVYAHIPTKADVERTARVRAGQRDVGDEIATLLRACKTLDDVYQEGAKYLAVKEKELRDRYGHLNHGQQRMNIGNRMRSKWRKENGHG